MPTDRGSYNGGKEGSPELDFEGEAGERDVQEIQEEQLPGALSLEQASGSALQKHAVEADVLKKIDRANSEDKNNQDPKTRDCGTRAPPQQACLACPSLSNG